MPNKINRILFWFSFILLISLFYAVKFLTPQLIQKFYLANNLELLNELFGVNIKMPLGFYLGRMEEVLSGPLSMLLGGATFLILSLKYFKDAKFRIFFFATFIFLILTKFEILFYPPFGDSIGGPFLEASWLYRNNFDYLSLAKQEGFIKGGPKIYLFSVYPTYLALMMKYVTNIKLNLLIHHLLVFAGGAAIIACIREILLKVADKKTAIIFALLVLSMPIFNSQVEVINMEIPMLAFATLAIYNLANKKFLRACLFAIIATMVKGVAIFICGVVFAVGIMAFIFDKEYKLKKTTLAASLIALAFIAAKLYLAFFVLNEAGNADMVGFLEGWYKLKKFAETYLFIFSAIVFIDILFFELIRHKLRIGEIFNKHFVAIIMFVTALGWFALFINSYAGFPRYRLLLMPFNLFCVFYALRYLIKSERLLRGIIISAIVLALLCSYGLFHADKKEIDQAQDHVTTERSLEYRINIKINMDVAKYVSESFPTNTVVAPYIMANMFAYHELGYVKEDMNTVVYGFHTAVKEIDSFQGLDKINLAKTVYIGPVTDLPVHLKHFGEYPVSPKDFVLKEFYLGNRKTTVFRGGIAVERMRLVGKQALKQLLGKGLLKDFYVHNFGMDKSYFGQEE